MSRSSNNTKQLKTAADLSVLIANLKTEKMGKMLMKDSESDKMPADFKPLFKDIGAALCPMGKANRKFLSKTGKFYTRHQLNDGGVGGWIVTESEMKALEAEFAKEVKDEMAILVNGVKDVARLLHLGAVKSADRVKRFSDKVKDMEYEEAMKKMFDPEIQVATEEEDNLLKDDAWLLIDM